MEGLGLIQQERMAAIEDRRRMIQRKNVGNVYRKNLQYTQLKKNPVLTELENLLLGHKEIDLYKKHKEETIPQEQETIQNLQPKKHVRAHELMQKTMDRNEYSDSSPVQPSIDTVTNGVRLKNTEIEDIAYLNEAPLEDEIPPHFSKELKLAPFADTIFGRSYVEQYSERLFKKAVATYTTHSEMAKNGYRPGIEPTISMIA